MSTTTLTPNAPLAYATLDHLTANRGLWDQRHYYLPIGDPSQFLTARACFMGRALLLAGIPMTVGGDVLMAEAPPWLSDAVLDERMERLGFVDERYPMVHLEACDVAQVLLGLTYEQAGLLIVPDNTLGDLHRLVGEFFGPRPGSADALAAALLLESAGTGQDGAL